MTEPEGGAFSDTTIEADGFRIRYREAGNGRPLICLHGGGGLRLSPMHDILAAERRIVALEVPGFGDSPVNDRSQTLDEVAVTMNRAVAALGIEQYDLMGTSFGAKLALSMALASAEPVGAVALLSPAAIRLGRSDGAAEPPVIGPETLYAHPERQPPREPIPPDVDAKQRALVARLIGPPRDQAFEQRLAELTLPVIALFGTDDRITPSDAARLYREIMPSCHLMLVYDAAHALDIERPEAVASVVTDFLERGERFLVRREDDLIHP